MIGKTLSAAFLGLLYSGAAAAEVTLVDASGLEFYIADTVTWTLSSTSQNYGSGNASDATYTAAVPTTTTSGDPISSTLSDAFDGYNGVTIDGTFFAYGGTTTAGCNGRELAFNAQEIGDLSVQRRVLVPDNDAFARWLTAVTNNGDAAATVNITVYSNLGSDSDTVILGSSSGDTTGDTNDDWVATGGDYGDPRLAHVMKNSLGTATLASAVFDDGEDDLVWSYELTLEPGETGSILNFVSGQPTNAEALAVAPGLTALGASATQCMTQADWDQVQNFGIDCTASDDVCVAGFWNPESGACDAGAGFEGESCDDGDDCTLDDVCGAGTCAGEVDPECGTDDTGEVGDDTGAGGDDTGDTGESKDGDCGCSSTTGPTGGLAGVLLLGLVALGRRRR